MLSILVCFPVLSGLVLLALRIGDRRRRNMAVFAVTALTSVLTWTAILCFPGATQTLLHLMPGIDIGLRLDGAASVFAGLVAFLWPLAVLYGFEYMEHEGGENHFFAMYTMTYGITLGVAMAADVLTLYLFYEFLSVATLPLVIHGSSPASCRAGRMYMYYCFAGAAVAFIGVMILLAVGAGNFAQPGIQELGDGLLSGNAVHVAFACCFLGFSVKAAMFPFHSWLPEAAVAPTPVTALLHAVAVVKSGAFAVLRVVYFCFGIGIVREMHAQNLMLILASISIVYGSLQAVREHHFKRRLAWSTVSNLSYILLAVSICSRAGLTAGLCHLVFHAVIKITLFYCAGAILIRTGKTQVEELRGLGRKMPLTCGVYAVAAVALTGTPLLPGFVSKWLIGTALVEEGQLIPMLGVAALLISAVLTAIYVLTPVFFMFFRAPLEETEEESVNLDPGLRMKIPLVILAVTILLMGLCSNQVVSIVSSIAANLL